MTVRINFLCFFFLLIGLSSWAQESGHRWGIKAGWTEAYISDQHMSPLLYQSDMLDVGGIYQKTEGTYLEIGLQVNVGTNQARQLGKRKGVFKEKVDINGEFESFDFTVNPFLSRFGTQFYIKTLFPVGGQGQLGFSLNFRYDFTGIAGDTWQYAQIDIAPEYQHTLLLPKGELQMAFGLPLLTGLVRPNWGIDPSLSDETNYFKGHVRLGSQITSVHEFFNPRFRVGYGLELNNGKTLMAQYHLTWTSYPEPRPLRMFEHGIGLVYFL